MAIIQKYKLQISNVDEDTGKVVSTSFVYTDEIPVPVQINKIEVRETITVKEKSVYVKGSNMQDGSVVFKNCKKSVIVFENAFDKVPRISLNFIDDAPVSNPYVTVVTKTSFQINFQNNVNCSLDWIAIERN